MRENPRCRRCPAGSRPRTVRVAWRSVFEEAGAKVVVDESSLGLIEGATVDFEEDMLKSSFVVVDNPLSESGCGCGSSFNVKL